MKKKFNFFKKAEMVVTHPHKFFDKVKKEKGMLKVLEYYAIFVLLSFIINTLFSLQDIIKAKLNLSAFAFAGIVVALIAMLLIGVVIVSLISFVLYYLYHIIIKLFKGKERYPETYKLLYAATPLLFVTLIPFTGAFKIIFYPLFIIAALDTFYLEYVGLRKLQKMNKENAITVIIISALIGAWSIWYLVKVGLLVL